MDEPALRQGALSPEQAASAEQSEVDHLVEALASALQAKAHTSASSWRQVPLLALLASRAGEGETTRRHQRERLEEVLHNGFWRLEPEAYLLSGVDCRTGDLLPHVHFRPGPGESLAPAQVSAAADVGFSVAALDGALVLEDLLTTTRSGWTLTPDALDGSIRRAITRDRVGFVAGWEGLSGPLHAASEALVSLAPGWGGSISELLRTAAALDDQGPELSGLAVWDVPLPE